MITQKIKYWKGPKGFRYIDVLEDPNNELLTQFYIVRSSSRQLILSREEVIALYKILRQVIGDTSK